MLTHEQARERALALVDRARRAGADAADVVYLADSSESLTIRLGKLEDVERSESEHIGLRVFAGRRSASIGSSDLSDAALAEMAERAIAMARLAPEDPYAGLAPEDRLGHAPWPELDIADPAEPGPADLRALAEAAEDAARAVAGVTNSEGAGASAGRSVVALATSGGFSGSYGGTSRMVSASVIAGEGASMQRDHAWSTARHAADLDSAHAIGTLAGQRAVARVSPGRLKSGPMTVVFDPRIGNSLLSHLVGAMSGAAIARRASFLLGREDQALFPADIRVIDDPLRPRGLRSKPFDGEGLPTARRALVADGRLTGWLMDSAAARQLGSAPTGHAARAPSGAPFVSTTNLHLEPGTVSRDALIADIADGVLVTELIGQGVNGITGDYSRGASGFRIVNGAIAGPVAEFTVAGNLIDMYARMTVADDLEFLHSVNVPTIRIEGMTVAGD
ncbi:MAG: TldD/PmbA family protein [Sphingomonadales bacterium]|nr:TldD/PmbA family protein [Sphingomonadales bacterium]